MCIQYITKFGDKSELILTRQNFGTSTIVIQIYFIKPEILKILRFSEDFLF